MISICIGVLFYFSKITPFVEKNLLAQIQKISKENQIELSWEALNVQPLLLQVSFKNIETPYLNSKIPSLSFQFAPLRSLLKQQLLFNAKINSLHEEFNWESDENSFFKTFTSLPLSKIKIQKSHLKINFSDKHLIFNNTQLTLKNHFQSLGIQLKTKMDASDSNFKIQTKALLEETQINIINFKIENKNSRLSFFGRSSLLSQIEDANFNINGIFSSEDFKNIAHVFNIHNFDDFSGIFDIRSQFNYTQTEKFSGQLQIEINDFIWKHISISKIQTHGTFARNIFQFKMAHLEKKDDWTLFSDQAQITLGQNFSFSFKSYNYIKNFTSFQNIFYAQTGVELNGHLDSLCEGQLKKFSIQCSLNGVANNLKHHATDYETIFFDVPLNFNGNFNWTNSEKNLSAQLKSSESEFQFTTQLESSYETKFNGQFDLSEISHISQLKVEGQLQVKKGKLTLSQNQIQAHAQLNSQKLILNDYTLGNLKTPLHLTTNFVHFKQIEGNLNQSQYTGKVRVLFSEDPRIQIQSQFKPLYLEDFKEFLDFNIPFDLSGKGLGTLNMDSPLDWNRIQYEITSQFENFYLKNEFFQSGNINIIAQDGRAQFQNTELKKIKGSLFATGTLQNAEILDIQIKGKELILDKISNFKKWLNPNVSGFFEFNLNITNILKAPHFNLQADLKNLAYFSSPLGEGSFNLNYSASQFQGDATFFNKKFVIENFNWSLKNSNSSLKLKAHEFDFTPLITNAPPTIQSLISGEASIQLNSNKLTSGYLNIENISLQQNTEYLKSTQPIYLKFQNEGFTFRGSSIQLQTNTSPLVIRKINSLESLVTGPIHLSFLTLLVPYVDYANGVLDTHISLKNHLKNWNPRGGLQIKNGSLKIGDILDPLQDIEFEGILNSHELEIKKLKTHTLTGNLSGSGKIKYSKKGNFPLELKGEFNQFGFNLSQNTRVQGSGSYILFGEQVPYTLKGTFNLIDGYSRQNFEENENEPESLLDEEKNSWFNLDILAFFENPFLIENSLVTTSLKGSLHLTGFYFSPIATGLLDFLPGGFFNIKEYEFEITQGSVNYDRHSIFNPHFDVIGKTTFEEVQYIEEREVLNNYEVTAQIYGHADSFKLNLSSEPYLSENNILSMMALGAKSIGFSGQAPLSSYLQIASLIFQDTVGRKLENVLGFRLSIVPYVDSSRPTRVKARKRWSNNLVTSVSSSLSSIDEIDRSLQIEYNLTPRLSLLGTWKETPYTTRQRNQNIDNQEEYNLEIEYKIDF